MARHVFDNNALGYSCLSLLKYYHHPAWVRCKEGKYLWVNNGFLKFFNVKMEQVIGNINSNFIPQDIADKSAASEQKVLEQRCSLTFHFEDKEYRRIVYKNPIFSDNNEIIAVASLMVDITQELELETQLNKTRDLYHSLLNNMGEALFFINNNLEFEIINNEGIKLLFDLGFQSVYNLQSWYEHHSEVYKKSFIEYTLDNSLTLRALKGEKILKEERSHITVSGVLKTFLVSAIPFKNENNKISGVIVTISDITKEKQLLTTISQKNEIVKQRNEELYHFAHSAAHDLRDPLRNISLAASMIEKNLQEKNYEEANILLKRLINTASYGGSLVQNLLNYSAANQEINLEEVWLKDIIDHNVDILNGCITQARANIIYDNLPHVLGNSQQLQIVFQNLISNSIRYKRPNSLIITISAIRKDQFWEVSIQDNGSGIDEKYKEIIFHPFKRLTADVNSRSSGLGLSICRRIIEQHGGKIWLEPQEKPGSCFKFILLAIRESS